MIKKLIILFFVIWLITLLIPAGGGTKRTTARRGGIGGAVERYLQIAQEARDTAQEAIDRANEQKQRREDALPKWRDAVKNYGFAKYIDEHFLDAGALIIRLEDEWHLLPKETRLQHAQDMWDIWAYESEYEQDASTIGTKSADGGYDFARIKLIDKIGNEVGGRSKGSDVKVND